MKKLSTYKKRKISENLEYFFNTATAEDYTEGLSWYKDANDIVQKFSKEYDFDPLVVANVLSALSPNNKWERNTYDTEQVLKAVRNGQTEDDIKVCTFNKNKAKAFELARGEREGIQYDNSPKTHSFVKNIAELNEDFVTIDIWHTRASFDKMIVPKSLSISNYEDIKDITIKNAKKHNIKPFEYQAIIWCSIRNR
jgi:hypothetical protein